MIYFIWFIYENSNPLKEWRLEWSIFSLLSDLLPFIKPINVSKFTSSLNYGGRKQVLTRGSGPIGPPRNWGSDSGPIAKKICSLRAKSVPKRGFTWLWFQSQRLFHCLGEAIDRLWEKKFITRTDIVYIHLS